jgi:hypothetical protein
MIQAQQAERLRLGENRHLGGLDEARQRLASSRRDCLEAGDQGRTARRAQKLDEAAPSPDEARRFVR